MFTRHSHWDAAPRAFQTPTMQQLMRKAARASKSSLALLIEGETSTGKKTLAQTIHANSPRKNKPFVEVDCAFFPDSISEVLFGTNQITPKNKKQSYKVATANSGSLFLENIDKLPFEAQKKLLQLIETGTFEQGRRMRTFDVRILASTHANLLEKVKKKLFLEDLFYRLNVMILSIPPLRERKEDIPVIAADFALQYSEQTGADICGINTEAGQILQQHEWPENIGELKSVIFEAAHYCKTSEITAADIARAAFGDGTFSRHSPSTQHAVISDHNDDQPTTLDLIDPMGELRPLVDLEAEIIRFALGYYKSHVSEVSRRLGIGRSTLYRKLKEHNLEENIPVIS